jgi:hypothetical protein
MARDSELDTQAARERCEAIIGARQAGSLLMTDDPKLTLKYLGLTDLPAALEALEEAEELVKILGRSLTECSAPKQDAGGLIRNRRMLALLRFLQERRERANERA